MESSVCALERMLYISTDCVCNSETVRHLPREEETEVNQRQNLTVTVKNYCGFCVIIDAVVDTVESNS